MKYNVKQIMKMAWEIARETAKEINRKVSEISFSECLKMAWESVKSNNQNKVTLVSKLISLLEEKHYNYEQTEADTFEISFIYKSVAYREYKNNKRFAACKTVKNTYNATTKTVDLVETLTLKFKSYINTMMIDVNTSYDEVKSLLNEATAGRFAARETYENIYNCSRLAGCTEKNEYLMKEMY